MSDPPVIFLDNDGVLNKLDHVEEVLDHAKDRSHAGVLATAKLCLQKEFVDRLQRIVNTTGAEVVVVSSWRRAFSLEELREIYIACGFTGVVRDKVSHWWSDERDLRAAEWIDTHPGVTRWVVLDDTRDGWKHHDLFKDVLVAPKDGLTDADVDLAIRYLSE